MPARTNEFQKLISIVTSHLDDRAIVTESAFLNDFHTGTKREVDITASGELCGESVLISIECRDHKRPQDVSWVEQMHSKHSRLATNILILVSNSSFTKEALDLAKQLGVRCVNFEDVSSMSAERLFADTHSLWGKTWEIRIERVRVTVEACGSLPEEWLKASPDTSIFAEDGSLVTDALDLTSEIARSKQVNEYLARHALPEHEFSVFGVDAPTRDGKRLCLQKLEPLLLRRIKNFEVVAKCRIVISEFPLKHGHYNTTRVAWGTGHLCGKPTMLVATG